MDARAHNYKQAIHTCAVDAITIELPGIFKQLVFSIGHYPIPSDG